jgi:uncharacterized protein YbbK (DUF523 family)/uncharacterized protein YbgA (DUF1722 family)
MGEKTRYDGSDKLDPLIVGALGRHVRLVPVCPEVECGLGVPREPMRLEQSGAGQRLVTVKTREDLTSAMERTASAILEKLEKEGLWGFISKGRSPTCGSAVAVWGAGARLKRKGIFMAAWEERFPLLPSEDAERIHSPEGRSHFIARLFTFKRWRETVGKGAGAGALKDFHAGHTLLLLAHSEAYFRKMEMLVAASGAGSLTEAQLTAAYGRLLPGALAKRATRAGHTRALRLASAHLEGIWTAKEKRETEGGIAAFRSGLAPPIDPRVLLRCYAQKYDAPFLKGQYYLNPDPAEAMLL